MDKVSILTSACLLGVNCRYNGTGDVHKNAVSLLSEAVLIPICPEQLGGLKTPREPAELLKGQVIDRNGIDITGEFKRGAREVLSMARIWQCDYAILKERSPSCGSGFVYDGSFSKQLVSGDGITAAFLKEKGVYVTGESGIPKLMQKVKQDRKTVLETERLILRRLRRSDFKALCTILQDEQCMYAYEHAFSDEEVWEWLERQLVRYSEYGFGLWAVILKDTGKLIGQCGITMQQWDEKQIPEIGYLFARDWWHHGFGLEAAAACRDYGFQQLGMDILYSIIRDNNVPSQNLARRNGMKVCGRTIKHYYQMDMPHLIFSVKNT